MWGKIFKLLVYILPYVPDVVNWILRRFNVKKVEIMEEKIKAVAKIIDDELDFREISKNMKNVFVRGLVASIEMFDGKVFSIALKEIIHLVPVDKRWIVEHYLDAILAKNWIVVTDTTAEVINVFVDVPGATEEQERDAYASVLVLILMFIQYKTKRKLSAV